MNCFLDEEALRYADLEHKRGGTDFAFLGGLSNFITSMDNSNGNFVQGGFFNWSARFSVPK